MSELLFDPKSIRTQSHFLTRILRLLFTKRKVTEEDFFKKHYKYESASNKTHYKIQSDRNNLKKMLRMPDNLTLKSFLFTLVDVMELDILELRIVCKDRVTGEVFDVANTDYIDEAGNYVSTPPVVVPKDPPRD